MLNDIKEHLKGSGERETKLLKKQSELKEKVIFYCILFYHEADIPIAKVTCRCDQIVFIASFSR